MSTGPHINFQTTCSACQAEGKKVEEMVRSAGVTDEWLIEEAVAKARCWDHRRSRTCVKT